MRPEFQEVEQRVCCDCGEHFKIPIGEQKFMASKGFVLPRRCHACRLEMRERKSQRDDERRAG